MLVFLNSVVLGLFIAFSGSGTIVKNKIKLLLKTPNPE
jgi:hypothetical protein